MGSVSFASAAWAQENTPSAGAELETSNEIIVTAQRRTERLQDVPISVSVLPPELTQTQAINTTLDLQRAVPGLIFRQANLNALPFIRGIGAANGAGGDEPGVALYVDGVYRGSSAASVFSLPNVQQIEVLKGPQGTLFGRNATGDVINIITKDPSDELGGRLSLGYANYDTFSGSAYITGPLAPNLTANLTGQYRKRADGWGRNVATGNEVYTNSSSSVAGKLKLDLENTILTLNGDWSRDRWDGGPGQPTGLLPGDRSSINGQVYYPGFFNVNSDIDSYLRTTNYGVSLNAEHDFGPLILRSISAYRGTKAALFADADVTPIFNFNFTSFLRERAFTQELQLVAAPDSDVKWIVGAFYFDSKTRLGPQRSLAPGSSTATFQRFHSSSLALFGQATVPLGNATNLTVGARYTIDEKKYTNINAAGIPTVLPDRTYKSPTWRLALDHKFDDDLMAYASYNRGFKSGAYGAGTVTPAVSPAVIDAFEVGFKSQWLDRMVTLNVAAFYSKYKNIQLTQTVVNAEAGTSFLQLLNAAAARVKGVDAELIVRPVTDLRLTGSVSLLDGKYTSFPNAPGFAPAPSGNGLIRTFNDLSGRRLENAPSVTASLSAAYVLHSSVGDIEFSVSDSFNSKYFTSTDHLRAMEAKHLVGAYVQWTSPDDRWSVQLWGSNLTNERFFESIAPTTYQMRVIPGAPRTYGVTATAKF